MKRSLVFFACFAIVAFACAGRVEDFESFLKDYGKEYDGMEKVRRFENFVDNMNYIETLGNRGVFGVTQFADMSRDEFKSIYLSGLELPHADIMEARRRVEFVTNDPIPSQYDWRDHGAVTPVKNQGQCGSCWSFSTTGNIEGRWYLAGHELITLSEQNLVDCDKTCNGCGGGIMDAAMRFIIQQGGIDLESCYPYEAVDTRGCRSVASCFTALISGVEYVSQDEAVIAEYLFLNGPIAIALNAGPLQFYTGGIYDPATPSQCDPSGIDHAVLLVGYGTDSAAGDFWIVKNSWGHSWAESGYFRIARGKGACGLNLYAMSATV